MKFYNHEGREIASAEKCAQPKFTNHRGRTWKSIEKIIDGKRVECRFDSARGRMLYVPVEGNWYRTPIARSDGTDALLDKEWLSTNMTVKRTANR